MAEFENQLGQPIGFPVEGWKNCPYPPRTPMVGRYCRVEPLDPGVHAVDLFDAYGKDTEGKVWTYMGYGPFQSFEEYQDWLQRDCTKDDPLFHAIVDLGSGKAVGVASYLRVVPDFGVIEIGHINFSPEIQKTPVATEAMYLMMKRVFDELGYRRYEWKCDALNAGSRKAAVRLGFVFEGVFRQAMLYKSRNRDTAWYSIVDSEWGAIRESFERWLAPDNFDAQGVQKQRLYDLRQLPAPDVVE